MHYNVELSLPDDSLHTLDPTLVLLRLRAEIPRVVVCLQDGAWATYDAFNELRGIAKGAVDVTENDARRRGPIWTFRVYCQGVAIEGGVERRRCWLLRKDEPVPEEVKGRFLEFLRSLEIPDATVESYTLEGNRREPW